MPETGPFESMKFRVKWDGRYVPGISKISGLRRSTEVVLHRDGSEPSVEQKLPGRSSFEPLGIERGITTDFLFEEWAQLMLSEFPGQSAFKDLIVELYDEAGALAVAYKVYRCWPSGYEALPVLDANGSSIAVERLILQYSSFERDTSVVAPSV